MDDPRRMPPGPSPAWAPPGSTVVHHQSPGVNVTITNVVGAPPYPDQQYHPPAYPPMYAPPQYQGYNTPYPQLAGPPVPTEGRSPGVMQVMREDASRQALAAVVRRGPAKVLGYAVAGLLIAAAVGIGGFAVPFGILPATALFSLIPLVLFAVLSATLGAKAGRGVATHHLELAVLKVASENRGIVRVIALAQATGRSLQECQLALDTMLRQGHATIESDENGGLFYRLPDLEPRNEPLLLVDQNQQSQKQGHRG